MSMFEAVKSVFGHYATFRGRARRSEYWYFILFNILVNILAVVLVTVGATMESAAVSGIVGLALLVYGLASILPSLALVCRRLHDTGKSGAYIFFGMIPVVGSILLLVWMFQDGDPATNQYGPSPKAPRSYGFDAPTASTAEVSPIPTALPATPPTAKTALPEHMVRLPNGAIIPVNGSATVGRSQSCDICLSGYNPVSGRHCMLEVRGGTMYVTDLGSTNGTYIRGEKLAANVPVRVDKGTVIELGRCCSVTIC